MTGDAFSFKVKSGGSFVPGDAFNSRMTDTHTAQKDAFAVRRTNQPKGIADDAFAIKSTNSNQQYLPDQFLVKLKSKNIEIAKHDAFSIKARYRSPSEYKEDAFSVKILNRKTKFSLDEDDFFAVRNSKSDKELSDAFVKKKHFFERKMFAGERKRLFALSLKSRKKLKSHENAFSLNPRKVKQDQERRRNSKEMGLFENGVIKK